MNQQNPSINETLVASKKSRKKTFIVIGIIIFAIAILNSGKSSDFSEKNQKLKQDQPAEQTKPVGGNSQTTQQPQIESPSVSADAAAKQTETKAPKYEVVHELSGKRYDEGMVYYLLIDPVKSAIPPSKRM